MGVIVGPIRTTFDADSAIGEKVTSFYSGVLRDEKGALVAAAGVSVMTLTVYALDAAQTVILDHVNILNDGVRGTLDANGNLGLTFLPADNAIVDTTKILERHVALIEWTTSGGKAGKREVEFQVKNLLKVT